MPSVPAASSQPGLDPRELSRLKWRCRRGLLENDLLIERFFAAHEATLTQAQARGLRVLMELPDNELLDLLLRRTEPADELAAPEVREVLELMRPAGRPPISDTPVVPPISEAGFGSEETR